MPLGAFFGKFFGNTISEAAGYGIGSALEKPLEPPLQELTNETWRAAVAAGATVPLEADAAAEIVAEDVELQAWGADQAAQTGIGGAQFAALVQAVLNAPGVSELLTLWRRGEITDNDFEHGLRKTRLESRWDTGLKALKAAKLSPQQLALGIVRSVVKDPGLLAVTLDTSDSNVAQYPEYPGDALEEAAAAGINADQLRVMVGEVGLPLAAGGAAQAFFKGILTRGAYNQAILEGDTRPEWADPLLENARQILTAHDWVELHLRGYIDVDAMYDGTALHGMSTADTDRLFQVLGRPLTVHQITTALARGAQFNPIEGELTDPYEASVHESNIKPSYYELAIANRYNYPSLFQLNTLVKGGAIDAATAADWATKDGYAPEVVTALTTYWKSIETTTAKPKKLTNATIRSAWKKGNLTREQALADLEGNGLSAADAAIYLEA
jgi:hypothetical protein